MIRVRTKFKMDEEISEHWSASKRERLQNSNTTPERGGLQGTDRAVTTYHLPLNKGGTVISKGSPAPEHHACVQRNYPYPSRTPTLRIDKHRTWANLKERQTATST